MLRASVSVNARITGYDAKKNTLTLEIIVPERFLPEDIQALKSGDAIWTGGQEIEVQTVADVDGYTVINEGEYEYSEGSVWLYEGLDMNYWVANVHDNVWILLATVDAPVTDHLLFLDEIDPATGDTLVHPTVHSGAEFRLRQFAESPLLRVHQAHRQKRRGDDGEDDPSAAPVRHAGRARHGPRLLRGGLLAFLALFVFFFGHEETV